MTTCQKIEQAHCGSASLPGDKNRIRNPECPNRKHASRRKRYRLSTHSPHSSWGSFLRCPSELQRDVVGKRTFPDDQCARDHCNVRSWMWHHNIPRGPDVGHIRSCWSRRTASLRGGARRMHISAEARRRFSSGCGSNAWHWHVRLLVDLVL